MSCRISSTLSWYSQSIRSKLLGWPTSIALAIVRSEGRGVKRPVTRYSGTTSLTLVAATKRVIGSPARFAINPAVRLPKFPDGVQHHNLRVEGLRSDRANAAWK